MIRALIRFSSRFDYLVVLAGCLICTAPGIAAPNAGLEVGIAQDAGTISTVLPPVTIGMWIEYVKFPNMRIEIEYLGFSVDNGLNMRYYNRGTIWALRRAEFSFYSHNLFLTSGLGWSYLKRTAGSDRGALGFRAGLEHPFSFLKNNQCSVGIRYSGTPWAGSGTMEDRMELTLGVFLIGNPSESNNVP